MENGLADFLFFISNKEKRFLASTPEIRAELQAEAASDV
jgi:hypothetical protein